MVSCFSYVHAWLNPHLCTAPSVRSNAFFFLKMFLYIILQRKTSIECLEIMTVHTVFFLLLSFILCTYQSVLMGSYSCFTMIMLLLLLTKLAYYWHTCHCLFSMCCHGTCLTYIIQIYTCACFGHTVVWAASWQMSFCCISFHPHAEVLCWRTMM